MSFVLYSLERKLFDGFDELVTEAPVCDTLQ